jgi:hypothetical protein
MEQEKKRSHSTRMFDMGRDRSLTDGTDSDTEKYEAVLAHAPAVLVLRDEGNDRVRRAENGAEDEEDRQSHEDGKEVNRLS